MAESQTKTSFDEAKAAFERSEQLVREASDALQQAERDCNRAFFAMKDLCPHNEGFAWNGFGGHNDVTYLCRVCGTSRADAQRSKTE
jgi:rubrerythrin